MDRKAKILIAVILFELAAIAGIASARAAAQTGTTPPSGSSLSFVGGSGSCDLPAVGKTVICGTSTGVLVSVNGAPFSDTKGATGPQGVAGPQGPAGPAGAQGVAGPAGKDGTSTNLTSFTCSSVVVTAAGLSGSGCSFK